MSITARVIGDVLMFTVFALGHITAEHRCPATFNCRHYLESIKADVSRIGFAKRSAMVAEDIRNLQR